MQILEEKLGRSCLPNTGMQMGEISTACLASLPGSVARGPRSVRMWPSEAMSLSAGHRKPHSHTHARAHTYTHIRAHKHAHSRCYRSHRAAYAAEIQTARLRANVKWRPSAARGALQTTARAVWRKSVENMQVTLSGLGLTVTLTRARSMADIIEPW